MEKNKEQINTVTNDKDKKGLSFFGKTKEAITRVVDQNDDGKFDKKDVSEIANKFGNTVKSGAISIKDNAEEQARNHKLKVLQPIFNETLESADFFMPKFIRVTERDKKHKDSELCKGSIGYFSNQKGMYIVNIFRDSVDVFGISFYPDCNSEFFYVDPSDRDSYISIEEYFNYLKVNRVTELQKIAQDLGAKHFRVTYKEEKNFSSRKILNGSTKVIKASTNMEHNKTEEKYTTVEIAAETDYPGHSPQKPKLKYLKKEPGIQNLIALRMDEHSPITHQLFMIKLSNSSGIKENDAMKIDAVIKSVKCSGHTSIASEARNESRRYFEYEIDF